SAQGLLRVEGPARAEAGPGASAHRRQARRPTTARAAPARQSAQALAVLGGIVRGKSVTLRTPTEADLPLVNAWLADMRVRRGGHRWEEPAALETWKERFKEAAKAEHMVLWVVEAEGKAAGIVRVEFWHEPPGGAAIHFFVIDPAVWRRGYGWDAALALHRYLFEYCDLKVVAATLPADNAGGLRIAERLGYREFGHGHDVHYRDGAYADQLEMRFDRAVWDERWSGEREYAPLAPDVTR
ncbi:MAG: GNAT family N-acetyltransferase, partial [Chloroflexota bacterium]